MKPRYPIYIPSKGRTHVKMTASYLEADGVPFYFVVEPNEEAAYRAAFPSASILVLPENDRGLVYSRNWIFDHAVASGAKRHWQLDDNIRGFRRLYKGQRLPCDAGVALRVCEDFSDRYENVALAGLNYQMFVTGKKGQPPFVANVHVYSCTLILNSLPIRFRGFYNEDVDICLQVLSRGWCTVLLNAFMADKQRTMMVRGGQTDVVYQGDGRLKMARALERAWPRVVETKRRFQRPQHVVKNSWRNFDTPLKRRTDVDFDALSREGPDEFGLSLRPRKEVKSAEIRRLVANQKPAKARRSRAP